MKHLNEWSRSDLLSLPVRGWKETSTYDSLLILSTRKKHDSGWAVMAIIGVVAGQPTEIASACCDDIEWKLPTMRGVSDDYTIGQMRMDCALKSGALHAWSHANRFRVGMALSSTQIEVFGNH